MWGLMAKATAVQCIIPGLKWHGDDGLQCSSISVVEKVPSESAAKAAKLRTVS